MIPRKMTGRERRDKLGKMAPGTSTNPVRIDLAAICVRGDDMAPLYRPGDVLLYRRPGADLTLQPGDDVLVLMTDPAGRLQLLLRRLIRWDNDALELRALNARYPPIHAHPRNAVLCGKVIARLTRTTQGRGRQR